MNCLLHHGSIEYISKYLLNLLSRDNLKASAVLMTSTYACNSNFLVDILMLWLSIANLNADCTSSVPCSKMAPVNETMDFR